MTNALLCAERRIIGADRQLLTYEDLAQHVVAHSAFAMV